MHLFIAQEFDPFRARTELSPFGTGHVLELQPNQIPMWLSFLPSGPADGPCQQSSPPDEAIFFGAVFDSGCGHALSAALRHLGPYKQYIAKYCDLKRPLKARSVHGVTADVNRLLGHLWIHSNLPLDAANKSAFVKVTLKTEGIACYGVVGHGKDDASSDVEQFGPRLPVLGSLTPARENERILELLELREPQTDRMRIFLCS